MIFYYHPITCATSAHIILLETELEFEYSLVDLRDGAHLQGDYIKVNPKGAVPALSIGDTLLTENQAILTYLADCVPEKRLIPYKGSLARAQAHEWMNYCAASLHPAIRSIFRPAAYAGEDQHGQRTVQTQGRVSLKKYAANVEDKLGQNKWAMGNEFSVCDAYLYLMYLWTQDNRIEVSIDSPKWRELALRVHERESAQAALDIEMKDRPSWELPEGF